MKTLRPIIAPPQGAAACTTAVKDKDGKFVVRYFYPSETTSVEMASADNFADFSKAIETRVNEKLPKALAQDPVTNAFRELLTADSAEAQLDAQVAGADSTAVQAQRDVIRRYAPRRNLKHAELKRFANLLFSLQLRQVPDDFAAGNTTLDATLVGRSEKLDTTLIAYLTAYYNGNFNDRMGTAISKPQLPTPNNLTNFSMPDSEIVAAETVLLEFMIDWIDPTPVMGKTDKNDKTKITYYPGGNANKPTALATGVAKYVELNDTGCGVTTNNVWVLKDLANAASDQATAVGGLVANTPGGISIGLGVLGKISIGDNQTLSDLVKTAASEFALRATLMVSYASLKNVTFNPPKPPGA